MMPPSQIQCNNYRPICSPSSPTLHLGGGCYRISLGDRQADADYKTPYEYGAINEGGCVPPSTDCSPNCPSRGVLGAELLGSEMLSTTSFANLRRCSVAICRWNQKLHASLLRLSFATIRPCILAHICTNRSPNHICM